MVRQSKQSLSVFLVIFAAIELLMDEVFQPSF